MQQCRNYGTRACVYVSWNLLLGCMYCAGYSIMQQCSHIRDVVDARCRKDRSKQETSELSFMVFTFPQWPCSVGLTVCTPCQNGSINSLHSEVDGSD